MLKVAYSPVFVYHVPDKHRFPMQKYPMIAERYMAGMNVKSAGIQKSDFTFSPVNEIKCDLMK